MTKRFALGIDLGTSNSALAYRALDGDESPQVLPVPQLLSFQSLGERETLPSAIAKQASSLLQKVESGGER